MIFEDQFTGIQVVQVNETGKYGDDDTAKTVSETTILNATRFLEPLSGSNKQNVIEELGFQVAQVYKVYFEISDSILENMLVRFNTSNIYQGIAFDATQTSNITQIMIHTFTPGGLGLGMKEAICISY